MSKLSDQCDEEKKLDPGSTMFDFMKKRVINQNSHSIEALDELVTGALAGLTWDSEAMLASKDQ